MPTRLFRRPDRAILRETWRLALPVVAVQVGLMLMGTVDALLVGRVGAAALAGTALGNLAFVTVTIVALGTLMALDPLVSQAVGAGDRRAIRAHAQRGLVLAAWLTVPCSLLLLGSGPVLRLAGQPADVVPLAVGYAWRCIPGVLPFLVFAALRQTLQALGRVRDVVVVIVAANLLNAVLDVWFIFGGFGLPAMGVAGAAWATTLCRWAMAAGLLGLAWPTLRGHIGGSWVGAGAPEPLWRMVRTGLPIGLQLEVELGAFGAVALLMGRFGTAAIAAHQVAINLASLTFMVPLGIGAAAAVLVGRAVGRGDAAGAREAARCSVLLGAGFMTTTAALFLAVPGLLGRLYTTDAAVLALSGALLPIAGVFQIFDGIQAVLAGVLRGAGATHAALRANLLGFWAFGLPVSVGLAWGTTLGARGLWWGLVAGLGVVSGLLLRDAHRRIGRFSDDGPDGNVTAA